MKRATTIILVMVLYMFLSIFFLAQPSSAIDDLDKKKKITLDELIAGAKKEGTLVYYSSYSPKYIEPIVKEFTKAYPFIKIEWIRAGGPAIAQRFYAEKSRNINTCDIVECATEFFTAWRKEDYLARVDNLPEWESIPEIARGPHGYRVSVNYLGHLMAWNRNVYKDEEVPADLWEFTKPKWKNKCAAGDPTVAGFALQWFGYASELRRKHPLCTVSDSGLGLKWCEAMRDNGLLLAGQTGALIETVSSGRRPIMIHNHEYEVDFAIKEGANLGWRYPKQGPFAQFSTFGINSESKHPYAVRLFLNWMISKEGQIAYTKIGDNIVRKDMKNTDYFKDRMPLDKCWILDYEAITPEESRDFIRVLNKAIRGKEEK